MPKPILSQRQGEGFASTNGVQRLQHVRKGVMGSEWQRQVWSEEGYVHSNVGACVLFKRVFAPSLVSHCHCFFAAAMTFNRLTSENVEMLHQSSSESELEGHRQHQSRQLFMGDDSLQISQSVERHSGWQWGVPWNWRSQQPAFISSGFFQWGAIAWQHEVIGGYVITLTNPLCINTCF